MGNSSINGGLNGKLHRDFVGPFKTGLLKQRRWLTGPGDWSRCYSATVQASAELVRCGLGQRSKITAMQAIEARSGWHHQTWAGRSFRNWKWSLLKTANQLPDFSSKVWFNQRVNFECDHPITFSVFRFFRSQNYVFRSQQRSGQPGTFHRFTGPPRRSWIQMFSRRSNLLSATTSHLPAKSHWTVLLASRYLMLSYVLCYLMFSWKSFCTKTSHIVSEMKTWPICGFLGFWHVLTNSTSRLV